uniref:Phosphoprotein n=1 Tax=Citrus-associated rhabdovirus TaxID=2754374 RepID=A0A7D7QSJ7_9RHAB|nr:phosphoprotein [Citrus-associated rhabdovirus]
MSGDEIDDKTLQKVIQENIEEIAKKGPLQRENLSGVDEETSNASPQKPEVLEEKITANPPVNARAEIHAEPEKEKVQVTPPAKTTTAKPGTPRYVIKDKKNALLSAIASPSKSRDTAKPPLSSPRKSETTSETSSLKGSSDDNSASESEKSKRTSYSVDDLEKLGKKLATKKEIEDFMTELCKQKGINYKRQWGNELTSRLIKGQLMTEGIVEIFLAGITMERAYSVTEGFEKTVKELAEKVAKLDKVSNNLIGGVKKMDSSIKRLDEVNQDSMKEVETVMADHRHALVEVISMIPSDFPPSENPTKSKEEKKKPPKVEKPASKEEEVLGEEVSLSELDEGGLALAFLDEIGANVKASDLTIVSDAICHYIDSDEIKGYLLEGISNDERRGHRDRVKKYVKMYVAYLEAEKERKGKEAKNETKERGEGEKEKKRKKNIKSYY